jgi:hypothetical protein
MDVLNPLLAVSGHAGMLLNAFRFSNLFSYDLGKENMIAMSCENWNFHII